MSSQERFAAGKSGEREQQRRGIRSAPQCQRRMTVKQISPVLFASDVDDVVYGCERLRHRGQAYRQAGLTPI